LPDGSEIQVFIQLLAVFDDLFQGHGGVFLNKVVK
jgi:hypothetical protein